MHSQAADFNGMSLAFGLFSPLALFTVNIVKAFRRCRPREMSCGSGVDRVKDYEI